MIDCPAVRRAWDLTIALTANAARSAPSPRCLFRFIDNKALLGTRIIGNMVDADGQTVTKEYFGRGSDLQALPHLLRFEGGAKIVRVNSIRRVTASQMILIRDNTAPIELEFASVSQSSPRHTYFNLTNVVISLISFNSSSIPSPHRRATMHQSLALLFLS